MLSKFRLWDEDSFLGGWARIIASVTAGVGFIAITLNNPEMTANALDLPAITEQGNKLIKSGFDFYLQASAFVAMLFPALSKLSAFLKR